MPLHFRSICSRIFTLLGIFFAPVVYGWSELQIQLPGDRKITIDGYVDTYYIYNFNSPPTPDRVFADIASRDNEFNVNLALLGASISGDRIRGRLAFQAGTSVQADYAEEPTFGKVSGPSVAQFINEANIGYRIADHTWVDAGIYPSYIGFESFITAQNWNYTRSVMAEYAPYYESGVKLSYEPEGVFSAQFHVMNGWGTIGSASASKSVGAQLALKGQSGLSFTYNTFFGEVVGTQWRFFNDFIAVIPSLLPYTDLALIFDAGWQRIAGSSQANPWWAAASELRYHFSPEFRLGARLETYNDPFATIISTPQSSRTIIYGASANLDFEPRSGILFRLELRGLWSPDAIFPFGNSFSNEDEFLATSLALSF